MEEFELPLPPRPSPVSDMGMPGITPVVAGPSCRSEARLVMLTGDNEATARRIARELGIESVIADVLPADKASW